MRRIQTRNKKGKVRRSIQTRNKKSKVRRSIQTRNKKGKVRRSIQTRKGGWPDWFKKPDKNKIYIDDVEDPVALEHIKLIEKNPILVDSLPSKKEFEYIKPDLFDFAIQNQRPLPQPQPRPQRQSQKSIYLDETFYKRVIDVLRSKLNIEKTDEELEKDLHRIVFKFDENNHINEINFTPQLDPSKTIIVYSTNDVSFDDYIKNIVESEGYDLVKLLYHIYRYYAMYDVGGLYSYFEKTKLSTQTNKHDTIRESVYVYRGDFTISYTDFFIELLKCGEIVYYNKQKSLYKQLKGVSVEDFLKIIRQFEDDPNDQNFVELIKIYYPSHFPLTVASLKF